MSLVVRLQNLVNDRIQAVVPDVMKTVWDASRLSTFIEQLSPQSSDGLQSIVDLKTGEKQDGDWHRIATFTGAAVTVLKSDSFDQFNFDPLWVDLVETSLVLTPETAVKVGGLSSRVRATFETMRQNWTDQGLITTVRFDLKGSWVRRLAGQTEFADPEINEGLALSSGGEV